MIKIYGLFSHPDYTQERKTLVGSEITIQWHDLKILLKHVTKNI